MNVSHKNYKVIFYTDTPLYGGAERAMLLLAKFLSKSNVTVSLICSDYPSLSKWRKEWEENSFKVFTLKVIHKHDPRHYFQLKRLLFKLKPDIFHVHLWNPASCRYAFLAFSKVKKKLPSLKLVTTEHDPFPIEGVKKKFKQWTLSLTDLIIAVSYANHKLLEGLYPKIKEKITTIHNGIELLEWQNRLEEAAIQRNNFRIELLKSKQEEILFLTIATLHSRKGLIYLIKAYAQVIEQYPATRLIIVGEGPQYQELRELIKNLDLDKNIMLQGYSEDVVSYLAGSDIFVLPSLKEAFGLVLLEAMVAKLPIIASKVGGIPEIITEGRNGLLVKAADETVLAEAMMQLLKSRSLRDAMSAYNNEDVKKFDAEKMALKTAYMYKNI